MKKKTSIGELKRSNVIAPEKGSGLTCFSLKPTCKKENRDDLATLGKQGEI